MRSEIIAGLDLGSSKISCMIAKIENLTPDKPEIVGVGISKFKGLKNGIVTALEETAEAIRAAVSEAERQASVKLTELYVGITGEHIKGENSIGLVNISRGNREITIGDVRQLIEQATSVNIQTDRDLLHAVPQEYIVDTNPGIKNPVGMYGNRLEGRIYMITGTTSVVQNICKAINKAGFKVREFILQSIASSYAILESDEKEFGCMVIDIGRSTTDGVVFQKSVIKDIFTIPLGSVNVTNDISIGLGISRQEAEEIKINYGVAHSEFAGNEMVKIRKFNKNVEQMIEKRNLASIIAPRVEEILGMVNERLKYTDLDTFSSGIVITGGMAKMKGIEEIAERIFGIPVRIGIISPIGEFNEEIKDPSYASIVGLIIYGAIHGGAIHSKNNNKEMGKYSSTHWMSKMGKRIGDWLLG